MGAFQVSPLAAQVLATWLLTTAASAYNVYVTNEKDNTVSIIDSTKLEVIKTVNVGQRPRGVILSKDGKWLLICASDDNHIQVLDARTLEFVKTLPSGPDPELFVLHPSGNPLYVASPRAELKFVRQPDYSRVPMYMQGEVQETYTRLREPHPDHGRVLTDDYNPVEFYDAANRERTRRYLANAMRDL